MKRRLLFILAVCGFVFATAQETPIWDKYELTFDSPKSYDNPIYEVRTFSVTFTAPSGRTRLVGGFWDGGNSWKVRFMPDETGEWRWETKCSDEKNSGLHGQKGVFRCVPNKQPHAIFQKGAVLNKPGMYHFIHADGTPFFWLACTAWNGALKSTVEEWNYYLKQRAENHYNTIQLVTTEWRGCDKNPEGETAIEGTGYIRVHPSFFKRIDERIDEANRQGFLVSPVILWALPTGAGRHLSPGYTLPLDEAVLLARYIVARYQGNHVIWSLGGDGKYLAEQEVKWKEIGRQVFNGIDHAPVTLHPQGSSWVGELYAPEEWYGMAGYQSSHNNGERVVNWINRGPMSTLWSKLKPMPYINMEPNYEQIRFSITDKDVRNASYWSLFATPVAGITYGANGIWPWLREGEKILNHSDAPGTSTWRVSIGFPGSIQMGYLYGLFNRFEWWKLLPANDLLNKQPGLTEYNRWISVLANPDRSLILIYIPAKGDIDLRNPAKINYSAQWFDPVNNRYEPAGVTQENGRIKASHTFETDRVLILKSEMKK